MGIITMGIPQDIILKLAQINKTEVFIETGTYRGGTTRWAAEHFKTVHTIERAEALYEEFSPQLSKIPAITPHLGDSKDVLPKIVESIGDQSAVHWLDGHWSGGPTAGEGDECPIMEELECLADRPNDLILIDDARFFLCAPPAPHRPEQWPTMGEISNALPGGDKQPFIQVVDDVIFIIPNRPELRAALTEYCQVQTVEFWDTFAKGQQGALGGIKKVVGGIKNRVVGS